MKVIEVQELLPIIIRLHARKRKQVKNFTQSKS